MRKQKERVRAKTLTHIHQEDSKPVDLLEYFKETSLIFSRAIYWELLLNNQNVLVTEREILKCKKDQPNQRVIRYDVKRTRAMFFDLEIHECYQTFITYYVKREAIQYKQGLNELGAPFIIFLKSGYPLEKIYRIFSVFIDMLIPNIYSDDDFMTLQCCFIFYNQLLRYHDGELHYFLNMNYLTPELYTTPWFITLFASKSSFKVAQTIFEYLIMIKDQFFIFYLCVAVMITNRKSIMLLDQAILPQYVTGIKLTSEDAVIEILQTASNLKKQTPSSFEINISQTLMFVKNYAKNPQFKNQMVEQLKKIEKQDVLSLVPFELYVNLQKMHRYLLLEGFEEQYMSCNALTCRKNRELARVIASQSKESSFKRQIFQLSPVESQICYNCSRPRDMGTIPSEIMHNKHSQQLYRMAQQYHSDFESQGQNYFLIFLNMTDTPVEITFPNRIILNLSKSQPQELDEKIQLIPKNFRSYCVIKCGEAELFNKSKIFKAFHDKLWSYKLNHVVYLQDDHDDFFSLVLGQNIVQRQFPTIDFFNKLIQNEQKIIPSILLDNRESQIINLLQNGSKDGENPLNHDKEHEEKKLDSEQLALIKQINEGVKSYRYKFHQDCTATIPNKTYYGSCVIYDKENLIVLKDNRLAQYLVSFEEQQIPNKHLRIHGIFSTGQIVSIRQNKNPKSVSIVFVIDAKTKLEKVLQIQKLYVKQAPKRGDNITVTLELNNPQQADILKSNLNKYLIDQYTL